MNRLSGIVASALVALAAQNAGAVELRVLEWEGYISPYKAAFEEHAKAKGMDVTLTLTKDESGQDQYIGSFDDIFEALRRDRADIVTPTNNYYKNENSKLMKLLAPIDTAQLSNYDSVFSGLRSASFAREGDGLFAVPLLGGSYALAYNTEKTSAPSSWADLLKPEAKGTFTITSDQFEANVFQMALLAGVNPKDLYDYDKYTDAQRKTTEENLVKLVSNAAGFWGGMPYPDEMKSLTYVSDYWIGVTAANAAGQKWAFATPSEGETVWLDTVAISKQVTDPDKLKAAHLLIDFMISEEIQKRIQSDLGVLMVNSKARDAINAERGLNLPGDEFYVEERLWQAMDPRTRNGFRGIWDRALKAAGKS